MRETDFLTELRELRNRVEIQQETLQGFNVRLEQFQADFEKVKNDLTFSRVIAAFATFLNFTH